MTASNIPDLIDRVDREFRQWRRFSNLWIWITAAFLVTFLGFIGIESYSDRAVRIAITAAIIAVLLGMVQIILDQWVTWIADANYRKIKGVEQDPLLFSLVLMKTRQPTINLSDAQRLNHKLFEADALIAMLYDR